MPSVFEKMLNHVMGHRPSAPQGLMKPNKYQTHTRNEGMRRGQKPDHEGGPHSQRLCSRIPCELSFWTPIARVAPAYTRASDTDHWNLKNHEESQPPKHNSVDITSERGSVVCS